MEEVIGSNPIFSTKKSAVLGLFCFMEFFVYIIYSEKCDKFYVGHTESIECRVDEHNTGKGGKFSKNCAPWTLKYREKFATRSEAVKREREIKSKKSRKYIESLIAQR